MKKTTLLLIGALAFVLQNATAQPYQVYHQDFEGTFIGSTPQSQEVGEDGSPEGVDLWSRVDNASSTTWDIEEIPDSRYPEYTSQMAVLSWAISDTSSWGTGFSLGDYNTTAAGVLNALSDLTFSLDIAVNGAGGPQPVTISFDQFPGGTRNFDASYTPTLVTDGSWNTPEMWNHVEFTLDQLTIAGGTYDPTMPFSIDVDSGPSGMQYVIGTDTIIMDRIELWAANPIPEPGTIALLTLGGLGALVAIRRRRA